MAPVVVAGDLRGCGAGFKLLVGSGSIWNSPIVD